MGNTGLTKLPPLNKDIRELAEGMAKNWIEGARQMPIVKYLINTVPDFCTFNYDFRHLPGHSADGIQAEIQRYIDEELLPRMKREYDGARVELECGAAVAALNASEQAAITALVRALTQDQGVRKVAYGTEAGQFAQAGIPAVLCGPGSIEQAHKANEYVDVEQLAQCDRFLRRIAESLC